MTAYQLFLVLILIVAVLLILVIMVQNPKGGGLSSTFGGGQNIGGVQNTNNFLDKSTWTLAIVMFALILLSNFAIPRNGGIDTKLNLDSVETTAPVTPAPASEAPAEQ